MSSGDALLLAIENSQRTGGVALRDAAGVVQVEPLSLRSRHEDDLLAAIDRLFTRLGLKPQDLRDGAVAVSIGPGGFTGLRIAVSTARMFAETLGTKLIGVPSALAAGQSHVGEGPIIIVLASKAETCWCTRLERGPSGHWQIVGEPGLMDADSIPVNDVEAVLGDEHVPGAIRHRCERAGVKLIEPVFDPVACLVAGERMLAIGQTTDPLYFSPLYPRQPEAVTLWNARAPGPPNTESGR